MPLCQVTCGSLETERTILIFTWSKWVLEEIVSTVRTEYSAQQLLQMNFPAWQAQTPAFPASSHIITSLRNNEKKCFDSTSNLCSNKTLTDELVLFPVNSVLDWARASGELGEKTGCMALFWVLVVSYKGCHWHKPQSYYFKTKISIIYFNKINFYPALLLYQVSKILIHFERYTSKAILSWK